MDFYDATSFVLWKATSSISLNEVLDPFEQIASTPDLLRNALPTPSSRSPSSQTPSKAFYRFSA